MHIAIIGAGFTGLSAGYLLSKAGVDVTIIEASGSPGGLAGGFKGRDWNWSLEQYYHHLFTSDNHVLDLAREVGHSVNFRKPISGTFIDGQIYQLDSPMSLLKFKKLSFLDRLRTGIVIAFLKINPFWRPLEKMTSYEFISKTMGMDSWNTIWKPLFEKKFGSVSGKINAAWFWARIVKRSTNLGYPEGGFLSLAKSIEKKITLNRGKFIYDTKVNSISKSGNLIEIEYGGNKQTFDKVICTLPSFTYLKIAKGLPQGYIDKLSNLEGLGAINLVLSLNKEFLTGKAYWLNINEKTFPFLAIVEHTNFIEAEKYGGEHIIYIANYLPFGHRYFALNENELLKEYMPYLQKINPEFNEKMINKPYVFKANFAQPVVRINHLQNVPKMTTPIPNLILANIQQVYPWDRGTNYAVELGRKAADIILNN